MTPSQRLRRCNFESLEPRHLLAALFVDAELGSDLQNSTAPDFAAISKPLRTIGRAALFAQPGDTVYVREGVYREQVNLSTSGTEGAPITFEAYNGEDVLVTTTELLTGWTQFSGDIYTATFDSNVQGRNSFTLFADGELTFEAHWSDLGGNVNTLTSNSYAAMDIGEKEYLIESSLIGLPDDHWNGAFVWAQTNDFTMESRRISDFDGSTGRITLATPFNNDPLRGDKFLIYDHLNALNAPGEWYFDEATDTVYFWAPGGGDPDNYLIEAKVRDEAFDLNGNSHIQFKGIDFRGGDLDMAGSNNILLQGAHIVAPDRGFGPEGSGGARALELTGSNNVIRDNHFEYVWATIANMQGDNNQFINNYVHDVGFNNSNSAVVYLGPDAEQTLISHNTITDVGRAAIGGPGGIRSVIQFNDMSRVAQMTADVGAIYLLNNSLGNGIIHHNVFHDITAKLSNGIYLDNNASDLTVHHNITYNTSAFGGKVNLPDAYILWFNNTHYSSGVIDAWGPSTSRDTSTGSKFFNNIISSLDSDLTSSADPAEASNNVFTSSSANFMNAAAGDFRLRSTSAAVDAGRQIQGITDGFAGSAPDAGALELGETMWDFGHNFAAPPYPVYEWFAVPYSNRVVNSGFDASLSFWTVASGSPQRVEGNAWNYRADGLALQGSGTLGVKPGDRLEQTITGLVPNTTYSVSAFARLVQDLQLEARDATSGSFTTGSHRAETYISDVQAGEWARFDGVDFGTGTPFYNRVEIGTLANTSLSVQLRLDSPTGQLIGTISVPSRGEPWFMSRADISAITGTHDLYVIFQGNGGAEGKFDRIRLLNTNEAERVTLGVTNYDNPSSTTALQIGGAYWASSAETLSFTTGPNSTSATVYVTKQEGRLTGFVDSVALTGASYQAPSPTVLELIVDQSSGRAVLHNVTDGPISFDGYRIFDSAASITPGEWLSLEDQGYDGGIWFEAGSPSSLSQIAELTNAAQTTLAAGQSLYLGQIVDPLLASQVGFEYFLSSTMQLSQGSVVFDDLQTTELPGDFNGDLIVDLADYAVWRDQLGASSPSFSGADGNGDGIVNASDYQVWKRHFGDTIAEPVSFLLNASYTAESTLPHSVEVIATPEKSYWPPMLALSQHNKTAANTAASPSRLILEEGSERDLQRGNHLMPWSGDVPSTKAGASPRFSIHKVLANEKTESDEMHILDVVFASWESKL